VFVICDLAQIEPRCLAYLSGNWALLERIAAGESIYEAHARGTMHWTGGPLKKENPRLYGLAKARVLGLGYQCAAERFVDVARIMGGIEISLAEAEKTVADFRRSNPLITGLWSKLEREFVSKHGKTYFLKLPSGRYLRYFDVDAETMTAANERGGTRYSFYGGKLVENYIQSTARDVFAENILHVEDAGFPVLFHVHDEVIVEVPVAQAEAAKTEIERLMSICPQWLEGCPLGAEAIVAEHYLK
jgi:DNA polymerase